MTYTYTHIHIYIYIYPGAENHTPCIGWHYLSNATRLMSGGTENLKAMSTVFRQPLRYAQSTY